MRVLVIVKADKQTEAGVLPTEKQLADMAKFNQQLIDAGMMLAGEGLHPSAKGVRVRYDRGKQTVTDGPFAETKELVAGYWVLKVKDMAEAVAWLKKAPFDPGAEVEIRRIFEADDFGAEFTPELRAQEDRQRAQIAQQQK
jgi:hypothetical protein